MVVLALGLVLAPVVAGWACMRITHSTGSRAFLASVLGIALLVFAAWFGGRADERPFEAVLAAFGTVACVYAAWRLRRSNLAHA